MRGEEGCREKRPSGAIRARMGPIPSLSDRWVLFEKRCLFGPPALVLQLGRVRRSGSHGGAPRQRAEENLG